MEAAEASMEVNRKIPWMQLPTFLFEEASVEAAELPTFRGSCRLLPWN